jgi:hypothetical protein
MKKKELFICCAFTILLSMHNDLYAQTTEEQRTDTTNVGAYHETGQQDSLTQQSVTISVVDSTRTTSSNYKPIESIRIYSGKHDGNNVIRKIEVPLPENSTGNSGVYTPH